MQVYKKILSTALAASMTLSAVPVAAVGEAEEITATPAAVEETAEVSLPPAEETAEETGEEEATEETAEENSEEQVGVQSEETTEQVEAQNLQDDAHEGYLDSTGVFYITEDGYITEFVKGGDVTVPEKLEVTINNETKQIPVTGLKAKKVEYGTNTNPYGDEVYVDTSNSSCVVGAEQVTSINLSACKSLKEIGDYAFGDCYNLTQVDLSGCTSLEIIGASSFYHGYNSPGITSFKMPTEGVGYTIGTEVFFGAAFDYKSKVSLDLSNCVGIKINAFYRSGLCGEVNLSNCKFIERQAFEGANITDVIWPTETMSTIPCRCFSSCYKLVNFNKTDDVAFNLAGIKKIEPNAFSYCNSITSVDLSDCESIEGSAFPGCSNLTDVIWPTETMPTIPRYCFEYCSKLVNFNKTDDIAFNLDGITEIGDYAFKQCGITGVVNLTNCESVGKGAFQGCTNAKPVVSTNTKTIGADAFGIAEYETTKGPLYVTVVADSEDDLKEYCAKITPSNTDADGNEQSPLAGLYDVKKIAVLKDAGVYSAPAELFDLLNYEYEAATYEMSTDLTYYIGVSKDEGYVACDGYTNLNAFTDIALKTAANGEERTSILTDTSLDSFPVSFVVTPDQYNENKKFYLSSEQNAEPTTELTLEKKGKNYYVSQSFDLNIKDFSDELAVLRLDPYVEITGSDNLTVGEQATYTARVAPASFAQNVVWSSDNESVLAFADDSSGNAATKGVGTATITATSADDETLYATRTVTVNPVISAGDATNGANNSNPTTGDSAGLLAALGAGMAALGLGALSLKKKKKEEE